VVEGLSFALAGGETLLLSGRNGSGKTTLLRALALFVPAESGTIIWRDRPVSEDPDGWRRDVAWLGHLDGLKGDLAAGENIAAAIHLQCGVAPSRAAIVEALERFGMAAAVDRPVRSLSAGQRRRVALARVALAGAPVWLLDEPLNALDSAAQAELTAALTHHAEAGGLAIVATHTPLDLPNARRLELAAP